MVVCFNCGEKFEAKRSDAKLCSAKCRQQANRSGIKVRRQNKVNTAPISIIEQYLSSGNQDAAKGAIPLPADYLHFEDIKAVSASGEEVPLRKFDGISRIVNVPKDEMDKRIAEGVARVNAGMAKATAFPTDYNDLLRLAKAGTADKDAFKKHIDSLKLTPNQKAMIYSKLK